MRPRPNRPLRPALLGWAAALAAGGCSPPPAPAPRPDPPAVEQARREERRRLLQQYWYDQTLSARPEGGAGAGPAPLEYPAGNYGGVEFGPRLAPDPSLSEPAR